MALCYRDMAFCSSGVPGGRCGTKWCDRIPSEVDRVRAANVALPICWLDFWDTCTIRTPSKDSTGAER